MMFGIHNGIFKKAEKSSIYLIPILAMLLSNPLAAEERYNKGDLLEKFWDSELHFEIRSRPVRFGNEIKVIFGMIYSYYFAMSIDPIHSYDEFIDFVFLYIVFFSYSESFFPTTKPLPIAVDNYDLALDVLSHYRSKCPTLDKYELRACVMRYLAQKLDIKHGGIGWDEGRENTWEYDLFGELTAKRAMAVDELKAKK